jgi:hypothetical protein
MRRVINGIRRACPIVKESIFRFMEPFGLILGFRYKRRKPFKRFPYRIRLNSPWLKPWAGTKAMGWDKSHGLGQKPWIGTKAMDWDKSHGLGQKPWAGIKAMDWDKNNGLEKIHEPGKEAIGWKNPWAGWMNAFVRRFTQPTGSTVGIYCPGVQPRGPNQSERHRFWKNISFDPTKPSTIRK